MMFDGIKISKVIDSRNLMTDNLHAIFNNRDWIRYKLDFNSGIDVKYDYRNSKLTIWGSLPYFMQGHNFVDPDGGVKAAIETIEELIGVDLMDAKVEYFEYGGVLQPTFEPQLVFQSHQQIQGYKENEYIDSKGRTTGHYYSKNGMMLKMYDPWANINSCTNKVSAANRTKLRKAGRHKGDNSLKVEFHCTNPRRFCDSLCLTVRELVSDSFEKQCQNELLSLYQRIGQVEVMEVSTNKNDLKSVALLILVLRKHGLNEVKEVDKIMNTLPKGVMTSNDRSRRRNILKKNFAKLKVQQKRYSLEELIKQQFKK